MIGRISGKHLEDQKTGKRHRSLLTSPVLRTKPFCFADFFCFLTNFVYKAILAIGSRWHGFDRVASVLHFVQIDPSQRASKLI